MSPKFEHDIGVNDQYVIRMKERFKWDIHKSIGERKKLLNRYHEKTRKYLYYINGKEKLNIVHKLKYLVLISGDNPFLKIDIIWDYNKNKVVSTDVFRGKNFKWVKN